MDHEDLPVSLPYRHTQVGYMTLVGLAAGFLTQLGRAVRDVRKDRRMKWVSVPRAVGFAAVLALFSSLHVTVDDSEVVVCFTMCLLPRRIPLGEISAAEIVAVPWYHGWGIRKRAGGWMYNVSGRRAVRLTLPDDRTFTIGSDQPEALLAAIEQARSRST
ncbi:MAG TPA: hypothetical protein VL117_11150, partial [Thermoleophilia bacterium]|nr:hypothetical protein [Thermoleophilia bacterium]